MPSYLYLRTTDDGCVLAGGEDSPFSARQQNPSLLKRKTARLVARVRRCFPELTLDVAFAWAGVFGSTHDGLPLIGQVPAHPHTWFALGYGGNGITFSAIAASLLRDACLGRPNPDAAIFAFDRPTSRPRRPRRWFG